MNKKKQFFLALLVIIFCYVASFIMSYMSLKSVISDNAKQVTQVISERIYDAINNELTKPIAVSLTMASDPYLIKRLKQEADHDLQQNVDDIADYLGHIRGRMGYETTFLVSEQSRYYYTHAGLNKRVDVDNDEHDIWYKLFVDHGKPYELNVDEDQTKSDTLTIFINTRIIDDEGALLGACGMGVQMNNLLKLVRENEEKFHVNIDLVDGTGLVLVDTDEDNIERKVLDNIPSDGLNDDGYVFKMEGESLVGARLVDNLSWYLVINDQENYSKSAFTSLLVGYLILLVILILFLLIAIYVVMKREQSLYVSSAIEVLTGLNSRLVYEQYIRELSKEGYKDVTYISLDLNGLKRVNDQIGHTAGDELIIAAGHYIRDYFVHSSRCYRIGGDEFAVIIDHCNVDKEKIYREFKEIVSRWHGSMVPEMSISMGIARGCDYKIEDIHKLIELADMEMYRDKDLYYQTHHR